MTATLPVPALSTIPLAAIQQERTRRAERALREFVAQAWHVLEPHTPFVPGIHVDAICQHLQAVTDGLILDLAINVPPGSAKSLFTAVFWPAWVWTRCPQARWIFSSYRADLSIRDSVKCRTLIESEWYQTRWPHVVLKEEVNQKIRYENTATGYRVIATVGSGTGERADYVVVDDPTSVDQAESPSERTKANEWWVGSMYNRVNDLRTGHHVVIQQRLNEDDLTGHLMAKGGYVLLMLPEEFEPDRACSTSIGWRDPRKNAGDLLWPARRGPTEIASLKVTLGSYRYAGQYQQRPSPAAGGVFRRHWWRYWRPPNLALPPVPVKLEDGTIEQRAAVPLPAKFHQVIQSWDMAFKDLATSDYVAGGVWGQIGADCYKLDLRWDRLSFPDTCKAVEGMTKDWPSASRKLIEDKANGPAVISTLQGSISGLIAVNPHGGKLARAHAVSAAVEAGNVYLPHPSIAQWVDAFIEQLGAFPNGKHDDLVDEATQALYHLQHSAGPVFPVAEADVFVDWREIPDSWERVFALNIETNATGCLWGARNPDTQQITVYAELFVRHSDPGEISRAIGKVGKWIPGIAEAVGDGRTKVDGKAAMQAYWDAGLDIEPIDAMPDAGLQIAGEMLASGKLKAFKTLSALLSEYRLYWKDDEGNVPDGFCLIQCLRMLCLSGRDRMKAKPMPRREPSPQPRLYSGNRDDVSGSWMG